MGRERRVHPRYRCDMEVLLHVGGGGRTYQARSWDLSANGIFVLLSQAVGLHQRIEMTLTSLDRSETLFLTGEVVHVAEGRGLGIRFSALSTRSNGALVGLLGRLQAAADGGEADPVPAEGAGGG